MALVTNNAFVSSRLHRGMRAHLKHTFSRIDVLDLHGSTKVAGPLGHARPGVDENVFEIAQGVAASVLIRGPAAGGRGVRYASLVGTRNQKLSRLASGALPSFEHVGSSAPFHSFASEQACPPEYETFHPLDQLFGFHSVCAKPGRDGLLVGFDADDLLAGLERRRREVQREVLSELTEAERKLRRLPLSEPLSRQRLIPYAYRPFDTRLAYYDPRVWTRPLTRLFERLDQGPFLLTSRLVKDARFAHVFAASALPDVIFLSASSSVNAYAFPAGALSPRLAAALVPGGQSSASQVLAYIYAVLHSDLYRQRYWPALVRDFPRIPAVSNESLFARLVECGQRLLSLHLNELAPDPGLCPRFRDGGNRKVLQVGERGCAVPGGGGFGRLAINTESAFEGVRLEAYELCVGGYQVAQKWLRDRRRAGRSLSDGDCAQYSRLVGSLAESVQQMRAIDAAIGAHGGFAAAFAAAPRLKRSSVSQ